MRWSPGRRAAGGGPAGQGVTVSVADLAHGVIMVVDPGQRDLLASVTASWRAGRVPRRGGGWLGGSVGSGMAAGVAADIVYPLLTGTLAQVLGTASIAGARQWRRPAARHARQVPDTHVALSGSQVGAIRSACLAHGKAMGLAEPKAKALADALEGVLRRELAGPGVRQ